MLLAPLGVVGRKDAARRIRVNTRAVQVRVEPYGRSAGEHASLDDDDDNAVTSTLTARTDHERSGAHAPSKAFLTRAAVLHEPAATSRLFFPPSHFAVRSAGQLGVPAGRAPPQA